jgi:hypothetical protein
VAVEDVGMLRPHTKVNPRSLSAESMPKTKPMRRRCVARIVGIWVAAVLVAAVAVDGQLPPQLQQQHPQLRRHHRSRRQQQQDSNSGIVLELLQASTGDRIAILTKDAVIAVSSEKRNDLTIVARLDDDNDETTTSTVKFALTRLGNNNDDDNDVYKKYEGRAPFALCGKKVVANNNKTGGGVSYNACNDTLLVVGSRYRLSATLATGVSVTMTFRLVSTTTEQQPNNDETEGGDNNNEAITFEYDLIDTSSSPQRVLYANMPNHAQIDRSTYWADLGNDDQATTPLTVAVRPVGQADGNTISLQFDNGRVEGRAPYSYCGDTNGGVYNGCFAVSSSTHTISFKVLSGGNNNQVVDTKQSFSFTLVNDDNNASDEDEAEEGEEEEEEPIVVVSAPAAAPQDEITPTEYESNDIVPAGSWQLRNNLPITARHEACFVWVDDRGYLIGGRRSPPTDIYDRGTDSWSTGNPPPIDLHHIQCVVVNSHEVWIVAAWTGSYPRETNVENIYIYDTMNDAWSTRPGLPVARRRGSAAVVYAAALQRIYVSHGSRGGHATSRNDDVVTTGYLDYYDLDRQVWVTDLPDAPHPRDHTGGAFLHDRYVCVAGGRNGGVVNWPAVLATDCFDTITSRWTTTTTTADLPAPRSGSSYGTSCSGDYMLLAGGEMGDRVYDDVYAFDGTTWTTLPHTLRTARHGSSLAMDCVCDRILLASGSGGPRGGPELTSMEVLGDGTC